MAVSKRQLEERKMRQERILDGALEVFKSEGMDGVTMDEIAARSGFGKATLYYYFHSKEEVFTAILENGWQNLWSSLETVIAGQHGPRQTFINVLLKIAENVRKRPGLFEFLFNAPKVIHFEEQPWRPFQNMVHSRDYWKMVLMLENSPQLIPSFFLKLWAASSWGWSSWETEINLYLKKTLKNY